MFTHLIITVLVVAIWVGLLLLVFWGGQYSMRRAWLPSVFGVVGLGLALSGQYFGLWVTPAEREMGDVYRIIYVHVPAVWMALMALTMNFTFSIGFLFNKSWRLDALAESSAEVGLLFGAIGISLGSIWARPTWGVWWDWDPRLTTTAIMLVAYAGYLALRRFVDDPERRGVWSAVVAIIAAVDLPIIWFSVRWWRSLHQLQSSPETISDSSMRWSLRWNAIAFLFLLIFFTLNRYRIARSVRDSEVALPPEHLTEQVAT